jgi:hypothetical protein
MGVEWDEFEKRGAERRENRRDYKRTDRVSVALGALLFGLIIFWVVWGLMS